MVVSCAGTSIFGASPPAPNQLNFVLVGNEMNPNGGMLARFPNLTIPSLGLSFYGATPSDTPYPTAIYTAEYDGFADFPRYPLNFVSDLNAMAGIIACARAGNVYFDTNAPWKSLKTDIPECHRVVDSSAPTGFP